MIELEKRKQMRKVLPLIVLLLLLSACSSRNNSPETPATTPGEVTASPKLAAGDYSQSINFGGRKRTYLLHLPPAISTQKALPMVLAFHGGGGNGQYMADSSQMSVKADKEGFIAVYPDGTGNQPDKLLTWNAFFCCAYAMENKVDDVGFVRNLIGSLEKIYPVDTKRIYATGMSNGAMMSYRLGTELADKLAAIAPVSGAMNGDEPQPAMPLSVLVFHGLKDEHVPYNGGVSTKSIVKNAAKGEFKPVSYVVSFWVKNDGANPTAVREEKGNIIKETYSGGKNGTEVVLYTLKNGGHAWPGGVKDRAIGDEPVKDISATDVMWDFFKSHPKS